MRKSKGNPPEGAEMIHTLENTLNGVVETWAMYDLGDKDKGRALKLCAESAVDGKANYSIVAKDGALTCVNDYSRLKKDRPLLFESVVSLVKGVCPVEERVSDEDDVYGDIARQRGLTLSPMQNFMSCISSFWKNELWNRITRAEREAQGVVFAPDWTDAIEGAWKGAYLKTDPEKAFHCPQEVLDYWNAWLKRGGTNYTKKELLQLDQMRVNGGFAPMNWQNYVAALETLAGCGVVDDENPIDAEAGEDLL